MKRLLASLFFVLCVLPSTACAEPDVMDGDILFHASQSFQSEAIALATGSQYTHCGIVFMRKGKAEVLEAVSTVRWTPLKEWIKRGSNGKYVLMRLKDHPSAESLTKLRKAAEQLIGKKYDLLFSWSDTAIYCSELVWKAYERGLGVKLVPLRQFKDYTLDHEEVQKQARERFGYDLPWDEYAVSPADLMESPLLETICRN